MANVIKLRKGLDINLKGKAAETYATVKEPGFYALVPDDFPGVTPKVVVKEQEYVMAGGPLFIDKYHPEVKFVSPVSGVVTSVERGARRKVLNIVVEAAAEQDYEDFGKKNVASMDAEAVKSALLEAGLFAFIKQRPYDIIADPTVTPKGIFISAFDTNPLAPDFEFALKGEEANFQTGLDALAKLAKTYLNISVKQNAAALTQAKNVTITAFDGPNPAGNVGDQINHHANPQKPGICRDPARLLHIEKEYCLLMRERISFENTHHTNQCCINQQHIPYHPDASIFLLFINLFYLLFHFLYLAVTLFLYLQHNYT